MAKNIIRLTEGDLHSIIKESVNKILKESGRNYKSKLHNIRAGAHAYGRGDEANDMVNDWLAKNAAVNDINKERNVRKNKIPTEKWDEVCDLDSHKAWDDYHRRSNNDFLSTVNYNDIGIVPEYGEDLLSTDNEW